VYTWWQMSDSLAHRNIAALDLAAKQDRARIDDLTTQLKLAQEALITTRVEISTLRVQVITLMAKVNGTGRTT